jgi:putative ATP-binding cassette transporter
MSCVPEFLAGTLSLGEVAQAVAAFAMVQSALNWLGDTYPGLAECLPSVNSVGSLLVALNELDRDGGSRFGADHAGRHGSQRRCFPAGPE